MRVALVTGGHPFERGPFLAMIDAVAEMVGSDRGTAIEVEHLEQPAARDRLGPGLVDADVVVLYDMPGLRFSRKSDDPRERERAVEHPVELVDPPPGYVDGLRRLVAGDGCDPVGLVVLHHAIASWPTSPEFAELVGGRFHYAPGELRGRSYPDSGYAFDVTHIVEVVDPDHPICRGVPATFELTDELYRFPVFEADVHPLMRTHHDMAGPGFFSADLAIRGERDSDRGWSHPPGSDLVAWTRQVGAEGRLAYLQFGDGPVTYAAPVFRRILANAIGWAAGTTAE